MIIFIFNLWIDINLNYNQVLFLLLLFHTLWVFHTSFYWRLRDNKFPRVTRTLLSILADLSHVVVWMVLIIPLIYTSTSLFFRFLRTILSAPNTLTLTFQFFSFLWQDPSICLFVFAFFYFHSLVCQNGKIHKTADSLTFLLINTRTGLLARIRWSVCISESQRMLWVSFS